MLLDTDNQCFHRGKTTYCQVVCFDKDNAPQCMTTVDYTQQKLAEMRDHADMGFKISAALVIALVIFSGFMTIRAVLQERKMLQRSDQ